MILNLNNCICNEVHIVTFTIADCKDTANFTSILVTVGIQLKKKLPEFYIPACRFFFLVSIYAMTSLTLQIVIQTTMKI